MSETIKKEEEVVETKTLGTVKKESFFGPFKIGDTSKIDNSVFGQHWAKVKQEEVLQGNISDEVRNMAPGLEIAKNVVVGLETYSPLIWTHKYTTNQPTFIVPKGTGGTPAAISAGQMTGSPMTVTGSTVAINQENGANVMWTRAYLEDMPYNVMAEQAVDCGNRIQNLLVVNALNYVTGAATAGMSAGALVHMTSGSTGPTFNDFRTLVADVDIGGYGPADYVICSPRLYWCFLGLEQIASSLYNGGASPITTGVAPTTLGVTIVKVSGMTQGGMEYAAALNSQKFLAEITRREIKVEPYERPEDNRYGFVASVRKAFSPIWTQALQLGRTNTGSF